MLLQSRAAALAYVTPRVFQGTDQQRANALRLVEQFGDRSSIESLDLALGDASSLVRTAAVFALARLGDQKEYAEILRTSRNEWEEEAVPSALVMVAPRAVPYLEMVVAGSDPATLSDERARADAARALCFMGEAGLAAWGS